MQRVSKANSVSRTHNQVAIKPEQRQISKKTQVFCTTIDVYLLKADGTRKFRCYNHLAGVPGDSVTKVCGDYNDTGLLGSVIV